MAIQSKAAGRYDLEDYDDEDDNGSLELSFGASRKPKRFPGEQLRGFGIGADQTLVDSSPSLHSPGLPSPGTYRSDYLPHDLIGNRSTGSPQHQQVRLFDSETVEPGDSSPIMSGLPWRQDTSYFVVNPSQKLLRNISKELVNSNRSNQSGKMHAKRDSKLLQQKMEEFKRAIESHRRLGETSPYSSRIGKNVVFEKQSSEDEKDEAALAAEMKGKMSKSEYKKWLEKAARARADVAAGKMSTKELH